MCSNLTSFIDGLFLHIWGKKKKLLENSGEIYRISRTKVPKSVMDEEEGLENVHVLMFLFSALFSFQDAQEELQEFQEGSRELEAELEAQLSQAEHRMRDLQTENEKVKNEVSNLKVTFTFYGYHL